MRKYVSDKGKSKVVKTTIQVLLLMVLLNVTTNGCVKQKNCDCVEALKGTWQYLKEPVFKEICSYKKVTIVAVFEKKGGGVMYFTSPVPSQYQSSKPVEVRLCAKPVYEGVQIQPIDCLNTAYKVTCIEEE